MTEQEIIDSITKQLLEVSKEKFVNIQIERNNDLVSFYTEILDETGEVLSCGSTNYRMEGKC